MIKLVQYVVDGDPGIHALLFTTDHLQVTLRDHKGKHLGDFCVQVLENGFLGPRHITSKIISFICTFLKKRSNMKYRNWDIISLTGLLLKLYMFNFAKYNVTDSITICNI